MIRVDLAENGEAVECALSAELGSALAASDAVAAVPAQSPGWWVVSPATRIGVVRIGDVEIWIKPKIPIRRLFFLLGYALTDVGWRDTDVPLTETSDLLVALAEAFARQANRALQQGLLQGYRVAEEALPVLRGRLRETAQMQRRFGLAVPVEVRYDDYTPDVAENQLLRAAAQKLLRLPRLPKRVRHLLLRLLLRLSDMTPLVPGHALPAWQPSRLNARYHVALRLAELVLRGGSVEHDRGQVRIDGFLLNMAKVFEDFLTVALREALSRYGGRCRTQDRWHLDEANAIVIRPDLVWYDDSDQVAAVIDAKYKAEKPAGFPDADLYQMLAYCTALGLPRGHLVYAKGNEVQARHMVRNAGIDIVQHALDLDQDPEPLLEQVAALAARIAADRQLNVA